MELQRIVNQASLSRTRLPFMNLIKYLAYAHKQITKFSPRLQLDV